MVAARGRSRVLHVVVNRRDFAHNVRIEQDLRAMKDVDLHIRLIPHRLANRLCEFACICLVAAHRVWNHWRPGPA